ncbi:peptidase, partial [Sphingobium yanoikuyae]
ISLIELLRLDRAASFVFRISGSSMIDAGIHDNDVVVVDRDTRPVEGHIVIAIVDGGFVCRQLCRRRGDLLLEARNAQQIYEPTPVEGVEIWGVVRTGVRDYRR